MLKTLDVICILDGALDRPKPKLVLCVAPKEGFFFRINSKPWPVAVCITKLPHHNFLDHDSYVECNGPLDLDDYVVDDGLRHHGILGTLDKKVVPAILDAIAKNGRISDSDKNIICASLSALIASEKNEPL